MFLIVVQFFPLFSQEKKIAIDSNLIKKDTAVIDTTARKRGLSKDAIDVTITHSAAGYRMTDLVQRKVWIVKDAKVVRGDITLKADSIELNMDTDEVFAIGRRDSTGKIIGSPDFTQGSQKFKAKELTYNFKTKKGRIIGTFTEQEQGFLYSDITKKMDDGNLNVGNSTFSTCDLEHPHFSLNFNKAKVIPGKKIITGPAYLVLEDIPLPIALPFGYFPVQKSRASGLILPHYTESQQLGLSLRDGGYYFVLNDYMDFTLLGTIYTNGTWLLDASTNYRRLYKYNGNFSFAYANNVSGHQGLSDYNKSANYHVIWSYNQDEKFMPGSRFSASVNMSSSGYDRNNSYNVSDHINTQRQSSISYSKTWIGTPFNFSTSINHSQNVSNKTVSLNFPKANFNISRLYPFRSSNISGTSKWYQDLQISYAAAVDNQINTIDSLLFKKTTYKNMRNGFSHQIPVSFQLRPFNNFNISPQLTYSGVLYTEKYNNRWVSDFFNSDLNKIVPTMVKDTLHGFFYGQAVSPSISASFNPQIFGMFQFTNPGSRIQAIRHVIRPSISFSYVPVIKGLATDMYKQVQTDVAGTKTEYSVFEGGIFGTPSLPTRSGAVSFSLLNIVEAKVVEKNDTTGKPRKVKIIDNLAINTSYNIFADSLRWSPVIMSYRATLFENMNFAANGSFSLYALNSQGTTINTFYYSQTKKPMRLTSLSATLDFDLGRFFQKKDTKKGKNPKEQLPNKPAGYAADAGKAADATSTTVTGGLPLDQYGYARFDVPWSLRVAYNFYYTKNLTKPTISQTLALSGDVSLTKKTRITYTTGYDIQNKAITMTSVGILRDLHCWEMSFDWIPTGYLKSWSFTIRVKASVLADLKYDRKKDFHDQY